MTRMVMLSQGALALFALTLAGCRPATQSRLADDAAAPATAAPAVRHQSPVPAFQLSWCDGAYDAADLQAMGQVTEVTDAHTRFPASYMFTPAGTDPHPGVLILHGSEGGRWSVLSMCEARYLAAHGYAALFLCYSDCGVDALPEAIDHVDLKRTADALAWLKASDAVQGKAVALEGYSRGAEQTVLLGTYLAQLGTAAPVHPDALFAHAPHGTIVGGFNWRWDDDDWRWEEAVRARLSCLQVDPQGPYSLKDQLGAVTKYSWKASDPACAVKPALAGGECWQEDPAGPYKDPAGSSKHYRWLADLCGVAPGVTEADSPAAWTWGGDATVVPQGQAIALGDYPGAALVIQGTKDEVWSVDEGAKALMATLDKASVTYAGKTVAPLTAPPSPALEATADRLQFTLFDGEKHGFAKPAEAAERQLILSFYQQKL